MKISLTIQIETQIPANIFQKIQDCITQLGVSQKAAQF